MGLVDGKVAFITGAARGQGRSHAIRLAGEGADIIAVDVCADLPTAIAKGSTPDDLEQTVKAVESLDRRIVAIQADVRDTGALKAAADTGVAELGKIDIVLGNAGIFNMFPATEMTPELWDEMISINLTGAWNACWATMPHLIAQGTGGSIVLTSSVAGAKGLIGAVHYVAAKHGVIGIVKALANELGRHHIRVNAVLPTTVNTPMVMNDATYRVFRPDLESPTQDDTVDLYTAMNILPVPWVEPSDVSNAVVWLASDQAKYVTGTALPIDAGCIQK